MAARPFQLHARKEIVTVETIARPVTSFADRETAEAEAELWRKAGFLAQVVDTSAGEVVEFPTPPEADDADADPEGGPTADDIPDEPDTELDL